MIVYSIQWWLRCKSISLPKKKRIKSLFQTFLYIIWKTLLPLHQFAFVFILVDIEQATTGEKKGKRTPNMQHNFQIKLYIRDCRMFPENYVYKLGWNAKYWSEFVVSINTLKFNVSHSFPSNHTIDNWKTKKKRKKMKTENDNPNSKQNKFQFEQTHNDKLVLHPNIELYGFLGQVLQNIQYSHWLLSLLIS